MTKDESIEILQDDAYMLYEDDSPYNRQAYDMAIEALERGVNAEDLIKKIKQLEPYNNTDCPQWVINIIKGEING